MSRRSDPGKLEDFVSGLDAPTLSGVLLELAREHEPVRQRLERLQLGSDPRALTRAFKTQLAKWRRATRFIDYRESHAFATELEAWLGQVERELSPNEPAAALELIETFIESDAKFFERSDDSDGCIGGAIGAACRLWLHTAARCQSPPSARAARLAELASADDYGAREVLLRQADLRGACACLRALLESILVRGHTNAYGHAERYYKKLGEIAARQADLRPLPLHYAFTAALRSNHGRKASFWKQTDR